MRQLLLRPEVSFRCLNRRMAGQHLNLLWFTASRSTEFRRRLAEVVRHANGSDIQLKQLPDEVLAKLIPADFVAAV